MKIGIIGCRGIPNAYGGFEQFAEYLSKGLVEKGHQVIVYNSHNHPYQKKEWNGVQIVHCYDPEETLGTAGQFIYDLNCIRDTHQRDFDIILQLGYTSNSIWADFLPPKAVIATNMDGLEWRRTKYSSLVQRFLRWAEKKAVQSSDYLIADSKGIKDYIVNKYNKKISYIPYGAHLFNNPKVELLHQYQVEPNKYFMLIARLVPENNIETILRGYINATTTYPFLVIGNHATPYGNYLKQTFAHSNIRFVGSIYNLEHLNQLRYFSKLYFHGHSVGGTNPSLLEAMASQALIAAHDNPFNQAILEEDAFYFENDTDVSNLINVTQKIDGTTKIENNYQKVIQHYQWHTIIEAYETFLMQTLQNSAKAQQPTKIINP